MDKGGRQPTTDRHRGVTHPLLAVDSTPPRSPDEEPGPPTTCTLARELTAAPAAPNHTTAQHTTVDKWQAMSARSLLLDKYMMLLPDARDLVLAVAVAAVARPAAALAAGSATVQLGT